MNLKHASYIMAIVECGGFTAAAKKLFISQPSLSQTVRAVEEELGTPIFDRNGKQPVLTLAGEKYIQYAKEILIAEKNLQNEIADIKNNHHATLRVGISVQRSITMLPQVLPEFIRKYPHVKIVLREMPSGHLEKLLLDGGCDVAFITTSTIQENVDYRLLENEQIVLLAANDTALARRLPEGTEIELSEARDEMFVNLTPGHSVRLIQNHLADLCGMTPRVALELYNLEAAKLTTAKLGAVMVCPYGYIQGDMRIESLTKCYPLHCHGYERHFYFCSLSRMKLPVYVRDLYEIAAGVCQHHKMKPAADPGAFNGKEGETR